MHQKHKNTITQNKLNPVKKSPGLVTSYDLQPENGAGLISKEKISKEKVKKKRISGEANDVNKQTVYCIYSAEINK